MSRVKRDIRSCEVCVIMKSIQMIKYVLLTIIISIFCVTWATGGELRSLAATETQPVKPSAYIFRIVFDSPVQASSQIEITFPEQFTLLQNIIASSGDITGGLSATIRKQKLVLTRLKKGEPYPGGNVLEIRSASIVNPPEMQREYEFNISLIDEMKETEHIKANVNIEPFTN